MGGTKTRSGKKQPAKKQAKPKIFMCPYTNQNVFIQRATVADLKSKSTYHSGGKKRLWTLSSSQQRHDLYADAAGVMASIEQNMLPSFGGRSWDVTCKLSEPNSQVLFRAWKGKMELAVLPHLLEKIPDPPRWPGQRDPQGEWEVMEGVDSDDEDPNDDYDELDAHIEESLEGIEYEECGMCGEEYNTGAKRPWDKTAQVPCCTSICYDRYVRWKLHMYYESMMVKPKIVYNNPTSYRHPHCRLCHFLVGDLICVNPSNKVRCEKCKHTCVPEDIYTTMTVQLEICRNKRLDDETRDIRLTNHRCGTGYPLYTVEELTYENRDDDDPDFYEKVTPCSECGGDSTFFVQGPCYRLQLDYECNIIHEVFCSNRCRENYEIGKALFTPSREAYLGGGAQPRRNEERPVITTQQSKFF